MAGRFNLALNLRMSGDKLPLSLCDLVAYTGTISRVFFLYLVLCMHKIFNFCPLPSIFIYRRFCSFSSLHFPYVIFPIRSIIFPLPPPPPPSSFACSSCTVLDVRSSSCTVLDVRNEKKNLVSNPVWKTLLFSPIRMWEDNTKLGLMAILCESGPNYLGCGCEPVAGPYEHCSGPAKPVYCGKFLEQLTYSQLCGVL